MTRWVPVPFRYVWFGHLFVGSLSGVLAFPAILIAFWVFSLEIRLGSLLLLCVLGVFLGSTLTSVFDYFYARRKRHSSPGGWVPVLFSLSVMTVSYYLWSLLLVGETVGRVLVGFLAFSVELTFVVLLRSWEEGMTQEEVHQAWVNTKKMTETYFSDEK
ncbi:hypothetical protein [Corynebacterium uterequi]|uniref:hypothetical protein n=1 Tax=Corynebacterium uterequi TaxID=1072256 RepID=UPI0006410DCA|nr:hypothetical protein [Corynebacterium uterequi]